MGDPRVEAAMAAGYVPEGLTADGLEKNYDAVGIGLVIALTALALLVVTARLASRRFVVKRFGLGLDDWLTLVSLIIYIPFSICAILLIRMGGARGPAFFEFIMDYETQDKIQILDSVAHLVYCTALLFCRVSGLAFYYRICALHTEFLMAIKVIFVALMLGFLAQICLIIFHCHPVTFVWIPAGGHDPEKYKCLAWFTIYTIISVISLVCDLMLFGLPVAMLKFLGMPRKQKVQLACILLPGIVVVIISVSRIFFVVWFGFAERPPFLWGLLGLLTVEVFEVGATLIALSLPGVKPLVDRFILRKDGSEFGSRGTSPRNSIGSQRSHPGSLRPPTHDDLLADEALSPYWPEDREDAMLKGIRVKTDVFIDEEKRPQWEKTRFF